MSGCTETDETNVVHVAVTQGDTLRLVVDLDAASGEIDITGWTWRCDASYSGGLVLQPMTVEVTDPAKGVLELSLSPEQTAAMMAVDYSWDLEATDTADDVRTLVTGRLRIRSDVT